MKKMSSGQETLFLAIVTLFWFAQYVYIPYQTTYLTGIEVPVSFVGMITGAYGISQMLFRLPVGLMADAAGRHRPFIKIGTFSSGLASVFRLLLPNGTGFLIANLFSGLASAMWISFMVLYSESYPADRQQEATGRIILFNNLGMMLGFVLSTLCYQNLGMRFLSLSSLIAGLSACCLSFFLRPMELSVSLAPRMRDLLRVCLDRKLILFAFFALLQQGIQLSTAMSFTSQVMRSLGASVPAVGLSSVVYMASAVAFAGFASTRACSKRGARFYVPFTFVCVAVYCILVPLCPSPGWIFVLQLLPGMSTGILFSFCTSQAMQNVPSDKHSTAMGFYQAFYAIGMTLFPILTGSASQRFGLPGAFFFLSALALLGFAVSLIYYRREARK